MNDVFGILMTVCFITCYIPQMIKIVKTKSVKDISPMMYVIATLGNLFAILYGVGGEIKPWLVIESFVCLILTCLVLGLWYKYEKL